MDFYEMDGAINKILLKHIGKYLLPGVVSVLIMIAAICFGSIFFSYKPLLSIILIFVLAYIMRKIFISYYISHYLDKMDVYFNSRAVVFHLKFLDDSFQLTTPSLGEVPMKLSYTAVRRMIETKKYYIMDLDWGLPVIIDKKELRITSPKAWKSFLLERGTNIKRLHI